ncbi:cyanophycin synthetase [Spirilliplanes yamanashiensis]|uniref:Cyanophycin synthetase n=1 Tax=Spirilliplanes yamanashiensis TaxID=42233 RepID=A0A8J3YC04_9ACTN|nr:cyanophycin synthetase [Spirilliplanes yamanashiensis]MDP9818653.1 cyanophycin synthetase [Spirilliplanes yamanashiensis]GIJ05109.1 cyanophycin synthetase [Spirilliplanes yamanashiensis]
MKILHIRHLRGPNVYLSRPAVVARLRLDELAGRESTEVAGFTERLLRILPGLTEHHCAAGAPGGFVSRLRGGTYFGHIAEHACIELSQLIGRDVSFGRTVSAGEPGLYDVIVECPVDEAAGSTLPGELLDLAVHLVTSLVDGGGDAPAQAGLAEQVRARLAALRELRDAEAAGPSTEAIIAAARRRGIPVERLGDDSLLRLGWGARRRLACAAMTDRTSAVGVDIACDKHLTRQLLGDAGVPVPAGGLAADADAAARLAADLGGPVVLKPRHGRHGRGVHLGLRGPDEVRRAYGEVGGDVIVERELGGRDYRVLVVAGEVAAAAERVAAHVVGDGEHTVQGLIGAANADPRRGDGHTRTLTRLIVDDHARALLADQGYGLDSVPQAGRTVWLRANANLSTGGTSRDVTDRVHPDVARLCVRAAALVGLDIAGIDLRLADIAAPLPAVAEPAEPDAGIIEVNAVPGLRMHLAPVQGRARAVGDAVVGAMFPGGADGRIPTVAVTGTNGKTTVTRLAAHLLAGTGQTVGVASSDDVRIGGRQVLRADATGPRSAQTVLGDPAVQVAVLETARGGILRRGLGYDWTDVGVVTNITADHLGQDGIESVEDVAHVKALVAERVRDGGTLVLNADDPWVRSLVERPRVRADRKRVVWFGTDPQNPVLAAHLGRGGTAYLLEDGWLVQAVGSRRTPLLRAAELPGSFGGAAPHAPGNALAAVAAARALGTPHDVVVERLAAFDPRQDNPGRGMLLRRDDVHLFVDYAHNPAALAAATRTLHRLFGRDRCVAAVTLPGDRRDDLLAASAQVIADGFARVVVYEDEDLRGRTPGEVPALVQREIRARRADARCERVTHAREALATALSMAQPGEVVLVCYEEIGPMLALLDELGAVPARAGLVGAR